MTEEKKPELADIPVVYMGRDDTSEGKAAIRIIPLDLLKAFEKPTKPDVIENVASLFETKKTLHRAIGAVYIARGKLADDGRLQTWVKDQLNFSDDLTDGLHVDRDLVARWEAQDKATIVARRARKIEADLLKDSQLAKHLRELRKSYIDTDKIGRLALEVVVLDILRHS